MLAAYVNVEKQSSAFCLLGAKSLLSSSLYLSNNSNTSVLLSSDASFDICSFATLFSEPTDGELMSFAENCETTASIAYVDSESCGSIAFAGGEACGSIATSSGFSSGTSAGCGGCSYSC